MYCTNFVDSRVITDTHTHTHTQTNRYINIYIYIYTYIRMYRLKTQCVVYI